MDNSQQKERDLARLEQLRGELEKAIASGDKTKIEIATYYFNQFETIIKSKYGET